jgi:hypothetical protein
MHPIHQSDKASSSFLKEVLDDSRVEFGCLSLSWTEQWMLEKFSTSSSFLGPFATKDVVSSAEELCK